ncbi:TPA: hypothetical protein ACH3X3_013437 [Trebouxia sp. C0006]
MSGEEAKLKLKIEQAEAAVARAQKDYEEAEPGSSKDSCLQLLLAEKASLLAKEKALEQVREKDLLQQRAAAGSSENMVDMRQQLVRIEAATLNTFHHMFAPSISDLSQRSKLAKRICTTTYNVDDRPAGQLWCMVLGRYLQDDMVKASHIYKRDWPAQIAALLKLGVDTAANLFSAQKKIESAFDKFRLIIVPNNLSDYTVSLSLLDLFAWGVRRCHHSAKSHNWFCGVQLHILDPSLGSEMINNTILNASGAAVKFADIDGTALQFVTETRPAKRAFAWHAEEALHFGKAVGWPAASLLTVPPSAWSSETCDSSIRDRYFHDLLELQAASVSDQDEGLHD